MVDGSKAWSAQHAPTKTCPNRDREERAKNSCLEAHAHGIMVQERNQTHSREDPQQEADSHHNGKKGRLAACCLVLSSNTETALNKLWLLTTGAARLGSQCDCTCIPGRRSQGSPSQTMWHSAVGTRDARTPQHTQQQLQECTVVRHAHTPHG